MWCYAFEAHSIQSWVMAGGKLRDVAGASRLLDRLCTWEKDDLVEDVIRPLGPEAAGIDFSRRAGGALIAFGKQEPLMAFRRAYTLAVRNAAPGLPFVDAMAEGGTQRAAYRVCREALRAARNTPVFDPLRAGPFHRLAQRTGQPGIMKPAHLEIGMADMDGGAIHGEILDAGQWSKRAEIDHRDAENSLDRKFGPKDATYFAVELDKDTQTGYPRMPFRGENRYIGLMHADGNGLGNTLVALGDALGDGEGTEFVEIFRDFSKALSDATKAAAERATQTLPIDRSGDYAVYPMRPILLGGDDLTVILRGDVAMDFTVAFLKAFEEETRSHFDCLRRKLTPSIADAIPEAFSAGAGIAYVKAKQPFAQAYDLCETLASHAKTQAKRSAPGRVPPSLVAFHRVSTSHIHAHYDDVREKELNAGEGAMWLGMGGYAVSGSGSGFPSLSSLRRLCEVIQSSSVSRGVLREYLGEGDAALAGDRMARGFAVLRRRDPDAHAALTEALGELGCKTAQIEAPVTEYRFDGSASKERGTPVFDALSLLAVEAVRDDAEEASDAA